MIRRFSEGISTSVHAVQKAIPDALPKRLKEKQQYVLFLLTILILTSIALLIICCIYSEISGNSAEYYEDPKSWQFCIIYADRTTSLWDQKLLDGTPPSLAYLGLMNMIYTWAGLASTFRSLYFYEWIPATLVFLIFNIFCQLCYYQSSNLVIVPPKLPLSLLSATEWVSFDMYDNMGKFCTDSYYNFVIKQGHIIPRAVPNCTDSVMIIDTQVQQSTDQMERINLLTNGTVLNEDLKCDTAVDFHIAFLVLCYILIAITFALIIILFSADREIRARRRLKHYFTSSGRDLEGDKLCVWLVFISALGFFITSLANFDASLVGLKAIHEYHLVDMSTTMQEQTGIGPVSIDIEFDFYLQSFMPYKTNQLNLQTVLLIITCMSVARGQFKQSTTAFKLAATTSFLAVLLQWPIIVGNTVTFSKADLWWWANSQKCADFHSGAPFFNPGTSASKRYCHDSRWSMAGALITFVAMHMNIFACLNVVVKNKSRQSLVVSPSPATSIDRTSLLHPTITEDDDFRSTRSTRSTKSSLNQKRPSSVTSDESENYDHLPSAI
mmetsp:Transcript_12889/g.16662  ORF Transcript_12889/g.16662 Transcript_12889/m.16662 type:complete len:553 (-) Transcript_12889:152-1810(-)